MELMKIDKQYGPVMPERNWAPAPSYLMRRRRILKVLAGQTRGKLLEVGCGAGTLLYELARQGFSCQGLETSPIAFETATHLNGHQTPILKQPGADWQECFDYLLAMEVLEHIENDRQALQLWLSWLKPAGKLLISVPAHESKWTAADTWAGHYRRYEKEDLLRMLAEAKLGVERIECWGFPLSNLLLGWRSRLSSKALSEREQAGGGRALNNARSGVDREKALRLYPLMASLPGKALMNMAFGLQNLTVNRDWGVGYLVFASKMPEAG